MGQPHGVAVDPNDGSIYVADLNHQRVGKRASSIHRGMKGTLLGGTAFGSDAGQRQ
jgi:DNA-binding beta-propeller fold protein YncE